jgi:hypothetical protein
MVDNITQFLEEKPYRCFIDLSCQSLTFLHRDKFRRHMRKHGIMIPFKTINKRKADEMVPDDGVMVLNEFKRYYTNLFLLLIDYLTNLKL